MGNLTNLLRGFFTTYEKDVEKALDDIFSTNVYFTADLSNIDRVKKQLMSYTDSIGKYCGYEIIAKRTIGNSMIHYSCIVNYEVRPLRYTFTLYKPKESWVLYHFGFDSNIEEELSESAKFYYIE